MHVELQQLKYEPTTGCTGGVDDTDPAFMMGTSLRMGKKRLDSPEQVGQKHNIFVNRRANLLMGDLNQGYDNQQSSEEVVDHV